MTSQTLTTERSVSPSLPATPSLAASADRATSLQPKKNPYSADQQIKFLHLQAEAETLLQELQAIKHQRELVSASSR